MLENGLEKCTCKRTKCKRFAKCDECIAHHKDKKNPPYCKRVFKDIETKANW